MSSIEKWAERVYAETDFGRSVATSLSGVVGLVIYLFSRDWVIAAFCSIIFFPIARLTATAIHSRLSQSAEHRSTRRKAERIYSSLSREERAVVALFASAGSAVLTWGQVNKSDVSGNAIESLIQRDVLSTSMTADGMRETFVLDTALFEVGICHVQKLPAP